MEFVNSLLVIKPYFDLDENEQELSLELVDLLNALTHDADRDVVEAAEHTDFELLNMKRRLKKEKRTQVNEDEEPDEVRVAWQKGLAVREKEEAEERKKRQEDDEENKYDLATFMAENKRWRSKLGGKYPYKRPIGGRLSDKHAAA
jgi:hypothetical protein